MYLLSNTFPKHKKMILFRRGKDRNKDRMPYHSKILQDEKCDLKYYVVN